MNDFVKAENVFLDKSFSNKSGLLLFLSERAVENGIAVDVQACKAAFDMRESEMSTGVIDGFAIPHAKASCIKEAAVMVVRSTEVVGDWESLDGSPITNAIALLVPDGEAGSTHIKLLSKTAVMLMDKQFRDTLRAATEPEEIAALINERLSSE